MGEPKISEAAAAVKGIDPIGIARLVVTERKYGPDAKRSFNPTTIEDILAEALLASEAKISALKETLGQIYERFGVRNEFDKFLNEILGVPSGSEGK